MLQANKILFTNAIGIMELHPINPQITRGVMFILHFLNYKVDIQLH